MAQLNYGMVISNSSDDVDPVSYCVGDTLFNGAGNMPVGVCDKYMSQRCSSNWDNYCDAYLYQSQGPDSNYVNKKFLNETAKHKYCRVDTSQPGVQCALQCESFDPRIQTSAKICEWIGTQNWLDTKDGTDLTGNFYHHIPLSPVYMDRCPMTCDAKDITIKPNDPVVDKCIENGSCGQILMDLAYYLTKQGKTVDNPVIQKLMAHVGKPFNPNVISRSAREYSVSPTEMLDILRDNHSITIPIKPPSNEPFMKTISSRQSITQKGLLIGGCILAAILILIILIILNKPKTRI